MTIKGGKVEFTHTWEQPTGDEEGTDYTDITLHVTAKITDYHPAVMYLRNGDPGYPEEGGEVEDLDVTFENGARLDPIPEELLKELEEQARMEHYENG